MKGSRLRVLGGTLKGRALEVPAAIRPSSGRLREALMGMWQMELPGCRFLDLFAGSGAVGIEAASRGAAEVVLVEGDPHVLKVLTDNCNRLAPQRTRALRTMLPAGLERWPDTIDRAFDLVFADPPYRFDHYRDLLVAASRFLRPTGTIAVEHATVDVENWTPESLQLHEQRRYGDSWVSFYEPA